VEPVGRLLEGYRAGLSASEAQTSAAQRAQSMALAQAQASENARLRQEQHQLDVQRFGLELRLKEQQAEQAAQEAAVQLEGQQGLQKELAQGVPIQQAFMKWAPKLLYKHPERLAQAIQAMTPAEAPTFGTSPEGLPYMQNPRTGQAVFPPAALLKPPVSAEAPTTAVKGRLQTGLLQGEKAVELGTELWNKLSPEDIGLRGVVNRVVINEGLAQLIPGLRKDSVVDAQSLLSNFNEKAVAAITASGDKRVSNADMLRYQKMLPKLSAGESLDSARTKISTFMDELRREAAKDAQRLGLPRPSWTLSKDEVVAAYKSGKISREEAVSLLKRFHTQD